MEELIRASIDVANGTDGAPENIEKSTFSINIKTVGSTTSSYGLDRYNNILERVYLTNNFSVKNSAVGRTFEYNSSVSGNLPDNDFLVVNQQLDQKENDTTYYYDSLDDSLDIDLGINTEFEKFIQNLGGEGKDVYYNGLIRKQDQGAFGGNGGGRSCKFKCHRKGLGMYKMIDGEYPLNNQGYVPVAYAVGSGSDDPVMVKDGV